jgi:hypothetical protein
MQTEIGNAKRPEDVLHSALYVLRAHLQYAVELDGLVLTPMVAKALAEANAAGEALTAQLAAELKALR